MAAIYLPHLLISSEIGFESHNGAYQVLPLLFPKMSVFPSRRAGGAWINIMPIKTPDAISGSNGVVYCNGIAPPTRLLLDTISRDPGFKYFGFAAIQRRADSGLSTSAAPAFNITWVMPHPSRC